MLLLPGGILLNHNHSIEAFAREPGSHVMGDGIRAGRRDLRKTASIDRKVRSTRAKYGIAGLRSQEERETTLCD